MNTCVVCQARFSASLFGQFCGIRCKASYTGSGAQLKVRQGVEQQGDKERFLEQLKAYADKQPKAALREFRAVLRGRQHRKQADATHNGKYPRLIHCARCGRSRRAKVPRDCYEQGFCGARCMKLGSVSVCIQPNEAPVIIIKRNN